MPDPSLFKRLRERKLVQWAFAYLAGAFVVFQAVEVVAEPWGISPALQRSVHILLVIGLLIALVLAWYHGEKGQQRVSGPELLVVAVLLAVGGVALSFFSGRTVPEPPGDRLSSEDALPLVVMMDSPHPVRVYDEEILEAAGTNADAISDILSDLPIRRQKEAIGPDWHRDEDIANFDPDLIVIHASGFVGGDTLTMTRERLKLFISYLADKDTKFLIYSRLGALPDLPVKDSGEFFQQWVTDLLGDLEPDHPGLLSRVRTFPIRKYGPPKWLDPNVATNLKLVVKEGRSIVCPEPALSHEPGT